MAKLLILAALVSLAYAIPSGTEYSAIDYYNRYGIPEAERIRQFEEKQAQAIQPKIVGGEAAGLGQFPYHAGLIADILGITGRGVCGGSLISSPRCSPRPTAGGTVVTEPGGSRSSSALPPSSPAVIGSIPAASPLTIDGSPGSFATTSRSLHCQPLFNSQVNETFACRGPQIILGNLTNPEDLIAPVALPSGSEVEESFAGETAIASGFGLTQDGGALEANQFLSHVELNVLDNRVCAVAFPYILQDSNICTSGRGGRSTCSGDSGGPLAVNRNGRPVVVGITSFGIAFGCQIGWPAAFVRVTSYLDWINANL